jgi:DNA-binding SARP family transcriptional activator
LLKMGQPVSVRGAGKAEGLLSALSLQYRDGVPREALLSALWPDSEPSLASQSLNSLVYSLHKLLGDAINDATPVLHVGGCYRLNIEAGVGLDTALFEALAGAGDQEAREGSSDTAVALYSRAVQLYRGDLYAGADIHAVVERERLRARYLNLLARLAQYSYDEGDYPACQEHALRMLANDPCREDAHRLVMRCCVRQGERAQAFRQYRLCTDILHAEFDADPEPATTALFEQVRLNPGGL